MAAAIADIIREGREAGEFRPAWTRRLGQQIGAMIDGLAIQVLMNDTAFTPTRMRALPRGRREAHRLRARTGTGRRQLVAHPGRIGPDPLACAAMEPSR